MKDPQTYAIIGAAMEVHRVLGHGFLEGVYQEALELEFQARGIPYKRETEVCIEYKGCILNKRYRADFECYDDIIVEVKAQQQLTTSDEGQLLNYLNATGCKRGLLINFGSPSLEFKRMIMTATTDKNE